MEVGIMSDDKGVPADVAAALVEWRAILDEDHQALRAIPDALAALRPPGMTWSRKQILGHLIDSAGNNHQRFVRAQFQSEMAFPPYVQDQWAAAQGCDEREWADLVVLWRAYNRHLLHVASRIPESALDNVCIVAANEPKALRHHVIDYVVHLRHHLRQILG
jgi:SH3-like domain-containing protein